MRSKIQVYIPVFIDRVTQQVCSALTALFHFFVDIFLWTFVPCTLYLGCVPPLLEVALRKFFPLLSVFCNSCPCCSLPLHDVVFPSHFGSAPRSSSFPHLPLCCAYCPPIVLHSCHMSSVYWFSHWFLHLGFCLLSLFLIFFFPLLFVLLVVYEQLFLLGSMFHSHKSSLA